MTVPLVSPKVRDALREIIEGKLVKRSRHSLLHEGLDLTSVFVEELGKAGYVSTTVGNVPVQPGERVPAFYIENGAAYFGWVFWEQFTSWKLRKLFGSVIKNARGDWEIQIPDTRPAPIYAHQTQKLEMDIEHPAEF